MTTEESKKCCSVCRKYKPLEHFAIRSKTGTRRHDCKDCYNIKRRAQYKNDKDHKQQGISRRRKNKFKLKKWFLEIKSQYECTDCGESDPACIDFHHYPERRNNGPTICQLLNSVSRKDKILSELEKCIALCANCHRKRHAKEDNTYYSLLSSEKI